MKKYIILSVFTLCGALMVMAQEKPQVKVDVSISNRNNPDETQEPGFEWWRVEQGKTSNVFETAGLRFSFHAPENQTPDYIVRSGWNKTLIQNADNKAKNGRLTMDGINLDPNDNDWKGPYYGAITLRIEGLPAGQHTVLTYHNWWGDAAKSYAAPMTVRCNGQVVAQQVVPTIGVAVSANVTIVTIPVTIAQEGDAAEIEFVTSADEPGAPAGDQTNYYYTPVVNGFEINTVNVATQAKDPTPASGDMHVDADNGKLTLQWTAANDKVREHRLYMAVNNPDAMSMVAALSPEDTGYAVDGLYSLNTYYWRVDEVDGEGNVVEGQVWSFRPRQLAFPGAEGYGRYALGGRGGVVYHVTNLRNDHNPGSLLYGLVDMEGPRTIVFDVSGIIDLEFAALFPKSHVTIAGQTAPGKGICVKGANINIGSESICRFMRLKRGLGVYGQNTGNAMGMSGADHAVVDHCTAAWGTDETVSGRGAKNISFQYCVISEALGIAGHKNYDDGTNHGYAATIDGKIGSWHHNLLVNCNGRNWSMGGGMDGDNRAIGQMDIFNNVVYNWNGRTTDGNCHEVNFVGNYYKMGPDTRRTVLFTQQYENVGHPESTWRAYIHGNVRENKNHTLTQDKKNDTYNIQLSNGDPGPTYETVVSEPFFPSHAEMHTAADALKIVTSYAGATMPVRDEHHMRNVRETIDGTWTYRGSKSGIRGEIDTEEDITEHAGGKGWEAYPEETRPEGWDTDQDGMPNWWEEITGSDPDAADNNADPDHDGYTLLEDYLEFMSHPYVIIQPDTDGTIDLSHHFSGFYGQNGKKVTPTFSLDDKTGTGIFAPSINGSMLTVRATQPGVKGAYRLKVTVDDGETTFPQWFGVAITADAASVISPLWNEDDMDVREREFFTLDGIKVTTLRPYETYVMRVVDAQGREHVAKVIAR